MRIGVIGGSGLYEMDGIQRKRWVGVTTPFGKPSDQYLTGRIGDRDVVFLPRHGRGHKILPSELNHRANLYGMKKLGVSHIISISAVGSLKEEYKPTDIVVVDQADLAACDPALGSGSSRRRSGPAPSRAD